MDLKAKFIYMLAVPTWHIIYNNQVKNIILELGYVKTKGVGKARMNFDHEISRH